MRECLAGDAGAGAAGRARSQPGAASGEGCALYRAGTAPSRYPRAATPAARAAPGAFDLVVTDFNMPGLSGLEVARALREIRADLPVALASGYVTEELRTQAPAAGVSELVYKPNTVDELCDLVARLAHAQRGKGNSS